MNLRTNPPPIPFIDVAAQRRRLGSAIDAAVARVLNHCQFILGPEVRAFEAELAEFCGARHVVTCASGTDALVLALRAMGVGPGDGVLCPSFTFCATAEVAALVGATPVFVDVDAETFNIDVKGLAGAATAAREAGLKPKAIIPVDLFGLAADHGAIEVAAKAENLLVLDDAAQGFGATYNNRRLGTFGQATATSFFPAKPLGCYGDGGAVMTNDDGLADALRSLRVHGQGSDKYDNVRIGLVSRLDTIQAAILSEKLKIFPDEIDARNKVAHRYNDALGDVATVPRVPASSTSVWAQYTIRVSGGRRDALAAVLKAEGIPTAIYYPIPLHRQQAYKHYPIGNGGVAVSDRLASEVISLPMHAYLDTATQDRIVDATRRALKS
ncbi:MAG TPA: DegT/DnrJ/EryC1/StrS family aminotransferase [Pseudolabrys sp.]|nr:DegT/DnrJ/EryC1/StrS family aminotransferase [Pseudolabrys sp.]